MRSSVSVPLFPLKLELPFAKQQNRSCHASHKISSNTDKARDIKGAQNQSGVCGFNQLCQVETTYIQLLD